MSEFDNEKTEEIFEVEESVDFEKLKKENHKKYRAVYLQVEKLGSRPHQIIDRAELKKLQNMDLYYDALKTGFFIEKYTEKLKYLYMDRKTTELIIKDVNMVCGKDRIKYEKLLDCVKYNHRTIYMNAEETKKYLIFVAVSSFSIIAAIILGVITHNYIFYMISVILACVFSIFSIFINIYLRKKARKY